MFVKLFLNNNKYNKLSWNQMNKNRHINDYIYLDSISPIEISKLIRKFPEISSYFANDLSNFYDCSGYGRVLVMVLSYTNDLSNFILRKTADTI